MNPPQEIAGVLSEFGLDAKAFASLGAHSYEQTLARAGADKLTAFYRLLRAPGLNLEEICAQAPAWPAGRYQGQQPSDSVVSKIKRMWKGEEVLNSLTESNEEVDRFEAKLVEKSPLPSGGLNALIFREVSKEVVKRRLLGIEFSDQLPVLDRLNTRDKIKVQQRNADTAFYKFMYGTVEKFTEFYADQRAREIMERVSDRGGQIQEMGLLMYGDLWNPVKPSAGA